MLRIVLVLAICFLASFLVYRRVPIQFLRAESGLYLSVSHSDLATQKRFTQKFFTESHGGHYTPFAFLAEFETARWVGTSRAIWRWRQIIAVAMLAALSCTALGALAATVGARPRDGAAIAVSLAALAAFQPAMADLVSWPFMIIQLLWLALLMVALWCIVLMIAQPTRPLWPWVAAAAAYASMHVSGLGLVTVAAVGAALLMRFVQAGKVAITGAPRSRKELLTPLATLLVAAAIHATAMIALLPRDTADAQTPTVHGLAALKFALGFVFNFAFAGLRNLSLTSPLPPTVLSVAYCWPLGLLLLALLAVALLKVWRRAARTAMPPSQLTSALVASFSAAGFITLVALVVSREIAEAPGHHRLAPYFNAFTSMPRYVIPVTYLLLPVLALVLVRVVKFSRFTWIGCIGLVLAAGVTQREFQRGPLQSVYPFTRVSHHSTWRLLLDLARECRAAQLPLPNLPLAALTGEFADKKVESFEPLLRHDLGLRPEDPLPLVELPALEANELQRYNSLPSMKELLRRLDLVLEHP